MDNEPAGIAGLVKQKAYSLGFDLCGIAPSRRLDEYSSRLYEWCKAGMNDRMGYLERDIEKRSDPELHLPGAKSVVVTGMNYFTTSLQRAAGVPVISRYALGRDYHDVIIPRLNDLLEYVRTLVPDAVGKAFCDSAPIFEKPLAVEAGLGWQGRHSIVINPQIGSFFFIGILILDFELGYDKPYAKDGCGQCRICIEGCPTGAINENRTIDARRCISNLTIENREPVPEELARSFEGRIYGCDICQELCPWNRDAKPHLNPELSISEELADMTLDKWHDLDEERFNSLFRGTPVQRVTFRKFRKNISSVTGIRR